MVFAKSNTRKISATSNLILNWLTTSVSIEPQFAFIKFIELACGTVKWLIGACFNVLDIVDNIKINLECTYSTHL